MILHSLADNRADLSIVNLDVLFDVYKDFHIRLKDLLGHQTAKGKGFVGRCPSLLNSLFCAGLSHRTVFHMVVGSQVARTLKAFTFVMIGLKDQLQSMYRIVKRGHIPYIYQKRNILVIPTPPYERSWI